MSEPVIIQTRNVSRLYPGVTALDSVNYQVIRNQVNVLIGENGAGKSTMMKLLAGVETPSSGTIELEGKAVALTSTQKAERLGISIIFQELNLFPNLSVMDNIFMANEFSSVAASMWIINISWPKPCCSGWSWTSIRIRRWAASVSAISSWLKLLALWLMTPGC